MDLDAVALLFVMLQFLPLRELTCFSAMHSGDLAICLEASASNALCFEGFQVV
jgi:hypothetical protein